MGEKINIAWADHTWNPWRGVKRRDVAPESNWRLPLQWDRDAAKAGVRRRVLCGSMMDWAEQWDQPVWRDGRQLLVADEEPDRWVPRPNGSERLTPTEEANLLNGVYRQLWLTDVRRRMFDTMKRTKHLDWMLLTKRPENVHAIAAELSGFYDFFDEQPQYWIGTSVKDQAAADVRIPQLLRIPAAVRFVILEPLTGPVDLKPYLPSPSGEPTCMNHFTGPFIDWVIVGSESGPNARPMNEDWVRSLRDQCQAAGVLFFYKQRTEGGKKVSMPKLDGIVWNEYPQR